MLGKTSMVQHNSKRHLFLLNDVILVTSTSTASLSKSASILGLTTDKLYVHNILYLNEVSVSNPLWSKLEENSCIFQVHKPDRSYDFIAETESDKRIWLEEIKAAIYSVKLSAPEALSIGWMHEVIIGTIFCAAYSGDMELITSILSDDVTEIDSTDELGMSPIHWAAFNGHSHMVEYLLKVGARIDQLNNGLNSALMLAAAQGHETVVLFLLANDADIHIRNIKDRDALYMAVLYAQQSKGLYLILRALIGHGVDVNMPDASGAPPLHECASRNLSRSVLLLVDCGAEVNVGHSRNGLTPLQLACTALIPDVETVRSLLDKGAFPNWKDAAMRTAIDMVLSTHALRFKNLAAQNLSTSDNDGMKRTVDEVASFVQDALPVLMELIRKGGRYPDDAIATLRKSFQVDYLFVSIANSLFLLTGSSQ